MHMPTSAEADVARGKDTLVLSPMNRQSRRRSDWTLDSDTKVAWGDVYSTFVESSLHVISGRSRL
jgi:hypothetical protein